MIFFLMRIQFKKVPFQFKINICFFQLSVVFSVKQVTDNSHGGIPQMEMYKVVDVSKNTVQMICLDLFETVFTVPPPQKTKPNQTKTKTLKPAVCKPLAKVQRILSYVCQWDSHVAYSYQTCKHTVGIDQRAFVSLGAVERLQIWVLLSSFYMSLFKWVKKVYPLYY